MRVLVVDQDSASNLALARSLRDLYTLDCVTNKGDCLDLLRSNTFEIIVATERLEDGSGLELLGTISKKWPSVLRIFAADRQRLQLLRGRLGPFELFQTLTYPIDPERLIATLALADAAQHADADTSDIEQIELSGEAPAEESAEAEEPAELADSLESEESEDFPAPRPAARAAPMEQAQAASGGGRGSSRGVSSHQSRPTPAQRPRSGGAAGAPTARSGSSSSTGRGTATNGPGARGSAPSARGSGGSGARSAAALSRGVDAAPTFAGSGTIGPRRGSVSSAEAPRSGRPRAATNKAPPVRFPPLERTPPLERIPPLEPPQESSGRRSGGDSFAEAAAMARAARSNYESTTEEFDTKRLAVMIGGGLAVVLAVVFLGVKMFGSKSDTPRPAPPAVAHAPEYPQEVTDLIAQTEGAFKADDFKTARADVDKLRQMSPSQPRLAFFEGLLTARADGAAKSGAAGAAGRGGSKKNGKSSTPVNTSPALASSSTSPLKADRGSAPASSGAASSGTASSRAASGVGAPSDSARATSASAGADVSSKGEPALAPETPVGFSRANTTSSDTQHSAEAARASADVASGTPGTAAGTSATAGTAASAAATAAASAPPAPAVAAASEAPRAAAPSSPSTRRGAGEPPPVVQEAKLIRRVNPDYPSAAKKDGIAGSVDLEVTVSAQGVVEDVSVLQANPPEMFEKSALAAVRKWKYDPRFVDGLPSPAHLKVHLDFGPNK